MYNDDEKTEFEPNPMGARQRLIPSHVFRAKQPIVAAPAEPLPVYAPEVRPEHTPPGGFPALEPVAPMFAPRIASLAEGPVAVMWEAPSYVASVPSVVPPAPMRAATARTRRGVSTWIAGSIGALAGLAIALGLSARSVEATAMDAGLATVEAEPIRAGWLETAREPAPPPEIDLDEIELEAPRVVKRARVQRASASAKRRPVKVNAASALGDLRVVRTR